MATNFHNSISQIIFGEDYKDSFGDLKYSLEEGTWVHESDYIMGRSALSPVIEKGTEKVDLYNKVWINRGYKLDRIVTEHFRDGWIGEFKNIPSGEFSFRLHCRIDLLDYKDDPWNIKVNDEIEIEDENFWKLPNRSMYRILGEIIRRENLNFLPWDYYTKRKFLVKPLAWFKKKWQRAKISARARYENAKQNWLFNQRSQYPWNAFASIDRLTIKEIKHFEKEYWEYKKKFGTPPPKIPTTMGSYLMPSLPVRHH